MDGVLPSAFFLLGDLGAIAYHLLLSHEVLPLKKIVKNEPLALLWGLHLWSCVAYYAVEENLNRIVQRQNPYYGLCLPLTTTVCFYWLKIVCQALILPSLLTHWAYIPVLLSLASILSHPCAQVVSLFVDHGLQQLEKTVNWMGQASKQKFVSVSGALRSALLSLHDFMLSGCQRLHECWQSTKLLSFNNHKQVGFFKLSQQPMVYKSSLLIKGQKCKSTGLTHRTNVSSVEKTQSKRSAWSF